MKARINRNAKFIPALSLVLSIALSIALFMALPFAAPASAAGGAVAANAAATAGESARAAVVARATGAPGKAALDKAVAEAAAYTLKTVKNPQVDSVGGEWAVIGLARSGYAVPDSWYENYRATVEKYAKACEGVLHDKKYTEYSRVILGLTAAGYDPRDVAGYDLTQPLEDFDRTVWQGINGPIWALIALDSLGYANGQRDGYIAEILRRQLDDGGWNLTGGASEQTKGQKSDPDLTGMALQALAKYQDRPEAKAATDRALACLSKAQDAKGGYASGMSGGAPALESVAQVLVALCELGIPADDVRFVKNGCTLVGNVLSFQNADGSFSHTADGSGNSQMSTEQGLYALAAAKRALEGGSSLYRMGDAVRRGAFKPLETNGLPGKHADVKKAPIAQPGAAFADVAAHPGRAAIEALAARGIIGGKGGGKFDPDGSVTRAEFAKMAALALGLPEKPGSPFADVPSGEWFAGPVATAHYYEIVSGVGGGKFNPGGTITRQDAAVMAARAAKLCGMDTALGDTAIRDALAQFGDYRSAADYAKPALAFCYAEGILDDSALDIEPAKAATRAEIAEMLYNLLDRAELL
ncbi:MAG: S-layer homology domain-containing protein [Clostridiales bacterium]|jgi:hypothetical protein|nr:S-layer homology domain-containing protein [Clostridiales bacterium]